MWATPCLLQAVPASKGSGVDVNLGTELIVPDSMGPPASALIRQPSLPSCVHRSPKAQARVLGGPPLHCRPMEDPPPGLGSGGPLGPAERLSPPTGKGPPLPRPASPAPPAAAASSGSGQQAGGLAAATAAGPSQEPAGSVLMSLWLDEQMRPSAAATKFHNAYLLECPTPKQAQAAECLALAWQELHYPLAGRPGQGWRVARAARCILGGMRGGGSCRPLHAPSVPPAAVHSLCDRKQSVPTALYRSASISIIATPALRLQVPGAACPRGAAAGGRHLAAAAGPPVGAPGQRRAAAAGAASSSSGRGRRGGCGAGRGRPAAERSAAGPAGGLSAGTAAAAAAAGAAGAAGGCGGAPPRGPADPAAGRAAQEALQQGAEEPTYTGAPGQAGEAGPVPRASSCAQGSHSSSCSRARSSDGGRASRRGASAGRGAGGGCSSRSGGGSASRRGFSSRRGRGASGETQAARGCRGSRAGGRPQP